jgi:hypothetical protein
MKNIKQSFSRYFVSVMPRTNDYHQIHKDGCPFLPEKEKRILLGQFDSGKEALIEGKSFFRKSECCRFCLKEQQQEIKEMIFSEIVFAENYPVTAMIQPSYDDALYSFVN